MPVLYLFFLIMQIIIDSLLTSLLPTIYCVESLGLNMARAENQNILKWGLAKLREECLAQSIDPAKMSLKQLQASLILCRAGINKTQCPQTFDRVLDQMEKSIQKVSESVPWVQGKVPMYKLLEEYAKVCVD